MLKTEKKKPKVSTVKPLVNNTKDPATIRAMFGKIAKRYDLANSIVSLNFQKSWNKKLAASLVHSQILLDLCSGTGEIAFRWLDLQKRPKVAILLDFCEEMLQGACAKSSPYIDKHTLKIIKADACSLPLEAGSVDGISIAYGIRNIQHPEKCFSEAFRVLQPLGKLAILELTEPSNPILNKLHRTYLDYVLPHLGGFITQQQEPYAYLAKSIQNFTKPQAIKDQLLKAGFIDVSIRPLTFGIATLIEAKVPGSQFTQAIDSDKE